MSFKEIKDKRVKKTLSLKEENKKIVDDYSEKIAKKNKQVLKEKDIKWDTEHDAYLEIFYDCLTDILANTLTVQLEENKSGIAPGSTVANGTDDGGLSSIKYLRVLQYADYYCWSIDTTQSTFRQDGIHMSKRGQQCIAKIIGRKVEQMNL